MIEDGIDYCDECDYVKSDCKCSRQLLERIAALEATNLLGSMRLETDEVERLGGKVAALEAESERRARALAVYVTKAEAENAKLRELLKELHDAKNIHKPKSCACYCRVCEALASTEASAMSTPEQRNHLRFRLTKESPESLAVLARDAIPALLDELEAAEDRIDELRDQVRRLTRERDEWEANEQEQRREVERLNEVIARCDSHADEASDDLVDAWRDASQLRERANLADELVTALKRNHWHSSSFDGCPTCTLLARHSSLPSTGVGTEG